MAAVTRISDIEPAVGTRLGSSDWFTIDQERVDAFASTTLDEQWIHVDPERAAEGPFGVTVVHGFLTLSLIPALTGALFDPEDASMVLNYGLDRVRFPAPLPVGTPIKLHTELTEATETRTGIRAILRIEAEAEGVDRPVVAADWVMLVVP